MPNPRSVTRHEGQFGPYLRIEFIGADDFGGEVDGLVVPSLHLDHGFGVGVFQGDVFLLGKILGVGHAEALDGEGRGRLIEEDVHDGIASLVVGGDDDFVVPSSFDGGDGFGVVGDAFGVTAALSFAEEVEERLGSHEFGAEIDRQAESAGGVGVGIGFVEVEFAGVGAEDADSEGLLEFVGGFVEFLGVDVFSPWKEGLSRKRVQRSV